MQDRALRSGFGQVLEKPLAHEEFDVLAVGRALLAEPEWVLRVRAGDLAGCRPYTKALLRTLD